jgi:predicted transcriptional regulator
VELRADEFEALRLMDYEGLYQEECAQRMGISRPTVSRMVAEARRKVADVLVHGKRLLIATEPSATVGEEVVEDAASPEAHILKSASSPASAEPETSPCATPAHGHSQDATGDSPAQG